MRARRVVVLLVAVLAVYAVLIAGRGLSLLADPRLAVKGLGVGVLLLPVLGVVLVVQEIRFGRAAERVSRRAADEAADGTGEDEPLARRPSGRIDRAAADAVFGRRRTEVEAAPGDWRAWVRLARAYGDAGDTARGRQAMRRAIVLERGDRVPAPGSHTS